MDVEGGTYTITISGLPADASFDQTTAEVTIAESGQTISRNFNGSWIRTASLMGMVSVEGVGLPGITVSISGRQEAQMQTDDNGQYTFTGLRAGNYTIEISGFDPTDVAFSSASSTETVAVGATKVVPFEGVYVRESTISGQVSVAGSGLAGVTVSLQGMGEDDQQNTDMGGQFTFSDLRAGEYQIAISGYDTREYGFSTTSATVRVEHGRTANVPFEGILLRTGSIMGQVSVEGEGLAEVTVSLSGEGENQTTMTDNSGQYTFSDLPAGNFSVGISGYDTDDYSFETTSKSVSLALGGTATVPFEGMLLRTSGISGRVSVEGMGLDSVTVTLSGGDLDADMATMTDATGQYAFAGLAEGDYTVAISDYDDVAYVFTSTSMDVMLGDDDTEIANFMGTHARTASISGMVYIDEAGKNDAYDDGENALTAPGIALALVGPGILDRTIGATLPDGSFSFGQLRAGPYQLVVANTLAAGPDFAYGGPAEGYGFNLGVGDMETQNIPFDITHTTVHFSVNLKSGDNMGDALPGATVSFFSDMAGEQKIGDAMSGDNGMASMRIARSMASNHTVYASVAAPAANYATDGAMQAVMWNAQMTMHAASNSSDITNTMADFSFSGATVTTDMGGGKALGGWAISVTSGDEAVEGAPAALGADGSASFSETAEAGKTYKVSIAADQANTMDGGEKYEATSVEYTHTGLRLPARMDAGSMVVTYTTQTLKVYVHNERDQVMGYTGNVLGGDARMSGVLDIGIRYIERSSGRSRAFLTTDKIRSNLGRTAGVYTFSNVPADKQVIVQADVRTGQNVKLLGDDELDAYTGHEDNGMTGGAFGDHGGYHHTVELCPLQSRPEDQRHGECGTFAFVNTYFVYGQVWEYSVANGPNGTFRAAAKTAFKGVTVGIDPVAGENLAGDSRSYTSGTDVRTRPDSINEAVHFRWGYNAAGEYKLSVSGGWLARVGAPGEAVAFGGELSPLGADLQIDVSPTTGYVYGIVEDDKGFRVEGATVTANSATGTTDAFGRYRIRGFSGATINRVPNRVAMTVTMEGFARGTANIAFASNHPAQQNFTLSGTAKTATVSGTVRSGGDAVAGVEIKVNGSAPLNAATSGANKGKLVTAADGTYSALVDATSGTAVITASKARMSFAPEAHTVTVSDGLEISGLDFAGFDHATISGRVLNENGGPMSGAIVMATAAGESAAADTDTTDVRGVYSLSVPFGRYTVSASSAGYNLSAAQDVNVGPGEAKSLDDFTATAISSDAMLSALSLSAGTLDPAFAGNVFSYTASVGNDVTSTTVTAAANDAGASVAINGQNTNELAVDLDVGANTITVMVTAANGDEADYTVTVTRAASSDASLSALSLSGVTLSPAFASGTYAYTANVGSEMASTTVEATANDAGASVTSITPADANMVEMGHQVDLAVGDNVITVTVTAADGSTQDYTVTVTRPVSTDASLSALSLSDITLSPAFASGTTAYTATVGYDDAETTVMATASNSGARVAIVPADANMVETGHQVGLSVGANVITVRVTAADGTTEQDYTVTVTRDAAPSSDASLSDLTLSGVTLDQTFASGTMAYTASVGNDVMQTTVDARQTHSSANVDIDPDDADAAMAGHQINLDVGDNAITITVTAESGAELEYTVTVTRAMSSDATLSEVTVNGMAVTDDDADGNYAAEVEYATDMATIAATPTSSVASATIVPADADDATDGHQLALNVGDNTATVIVIAEDGTREDYTVTVTRMAADATLSEVTVNGAAVTDDDDDGDYATDVGHDVTMATIAATATDAAGGATVAYSGMDADDMMDGHQVALDVGANVTTVTVTAADGGTADYTVTITRKADASLSEVMVNGAPVTDDDADGNYEAEVEFGVETATIAATATDEAGGATVTYSGMDADDMTDGHQVALDVGANMTTVTVTASDGGTADYTVTITRKADASLSEVMVNDAAATLGDDGNYTASVGSDVEMATIAATATDEAGGATVAYSGMDADDMTDGHQVTLAVGENMVTITVTASDGGTAEYTVTVTRAEPSPGIKISTTEIEMDEGESATYTVRLATMPSADVTVTITPASGLTVDRGEAGSPLNFPREAWNVEQTVELTAAEDADFANGEDLVVAHAAASSDATYEGSSQDVTVDVADDDVEARQVNVITGPATAPVTTNPGASVDLTIAEDATAASTFGVSLGAGEGATATGQPLGDVMVTIDVPEDMRFTVPGAVAANGGEELVLTFTPDNFRTAQTVTVQPNDDDIQSTGDAIAADALTVTAEGGGYNDTGVADDDDDDTNNAGYIAALGAVTVNVTITEDDEAGITVSPTAMQLVEGTEGSYTVTLTSDPGGILVITAASQDAAATVNPPTLTFTSSGPTAWDQPQTVTITAVEDDNGDNVTTTIEHSVVAQAGNGYANGALGDDDDDVDLTIVDDETAQIVLTPAGLSIAQGGSDSYTVGLTRAPATGETVTINVSAAAGLNVTEGAVLIFNAGNWETAQTVTIGVPASTAVGTLNVTLALDSSADAGTYTDNAAAGTVVVTVTAGS